jgi:chromosome segregation ATPase
MAPKTIAIRRPEVDPVSPIRDDIVRRPSSSSRHNKNSNSNRSGRTDSTRSDTGHHARASSSEGIMMDPAEHDAWRRLGGDTHPTTAQSNNTTATAEETVTTHSTSSTSAASSTTRELRQSVKKHERELEELKEKYEEAKTKMSKMKQEKSANKKMLLEMSGLIKSLQEISVDYEQTKKSQDDSSRHRSHLQNVQRKIQAIDMQMRAAKTQCGMLEEEKSLHTTTIKAQESQISALEDQIQFLVQRLEQQSQSNTQGQSELERIIQLQETQIWSLEGQISLLKRNAKERKIDSMEKQNAARYQEIDALENKLASLRQAQNAHKIQASLIRSMSKSQDSQDNEKSQMVTEEFKDDALFEEDASDIQSLEKDSSTAPQPEENEQPAKISKSVKRAKKPFGKSARKKKSLSHGNMSVASGSTTLSAIEEETETASESASIPGTSRTSTSETTNDVTTMDDDNEASSSEEEDSSTDDSSTTCAESSTCVSTSAAERDQKRFVTVEPSEDGSVEVMSHQEMETARKQEAEDTSVDSADPSVYVGDINENEKGNDHKEQIADGVGEPQPDKQHLHKELQVAKSRYENLKKDYNSIVSTSTDKMQKLEEEKRELLECQARALASAAEVTESSSASIAKLQRENDQLRKIVAQKEALVSLSETKFENLRMEHTQTILELKGKGTQNDDLFSSDSSSYDDRVVDIETYTRLEKVHEAVVMKLADLGEDNDRLEREHEVMKKKLQNLYMQLQSYDETVLELQKLKAAYRLLEEERDATLSKMERMEDHNRVRQNNSEETAILRLEYADALARIEVLEKTNEEFQNIETKYTASEVRVTVIGEELEKAKEKNKEQKKKLSERESQIREVIGQYKMLKQEHAQSQSKLKRLEKVIESDKQIAVKTTKSVGVNETSQTERTSSSAEFSYTKMAAMTSQLVAYESQINKLQKQRDAALEEMKEMEGELQKAKDDSISAVEAKKTREKDLRIVLQHYEKLQKKYEATTKDFGEMTQKYKETVQKIDGLEAQINGAEKKPQDGQREIEQLAYWDAETSGETKYSGKQEKSEEKQQKEISEEAPTLDSHFESEGSEKEVDKSQIDDEDSSIVQLLHDMEDLKRKKVNKTAAQDMAYEEEGISSVGKAKEKDPPSSDPPSRIEYDDMIRELEAAKESSDWKNEKIARVLCDLKAAHEQVEILEKEKSDLESDLSLLKGHLLISQRESSTAKERQENREVNLRNAIAKHHRLQQVYECLETKFNEVQEQLNAAHNETKRKEEEAKQARKRASGAHAQFKKLQVDHSAVLDRLEKLKQKLEMYETTPEF